MAFVNTSILGVEERLEQEKKITHRQKAAIIVLVNFMLGILKDAGNVGH